MGEIFYPDTTIQTNSCIRDDFHNWCPIEFLGEIFLFSLFRAVSRSSFQANQMEDYQYKTKKGKEKG